MQALEPNKATQTLVAWINWLKQDKRKHRQGGHRRLVASGGGWSLNASIAAPVDATVIYYGQVTRPAADLAKLKGRYSDSSPRRISGSTARWSPASRPR